MLDFLKQEMQSNGGTLAVGYTLVSQNGGLATLTAVDEIGVILMVANDRYAYPWSQIADIRVAN